jgi:hypothetical protein
VARRAVTGGEGNGSQNVRVFRVTGETRARSALPDVQLGDAEDASGGECGPARSAI